jgi:hypothetical protein
MCDAFAQYLHLWPARLYTICPYFLTNGTIMKKRYWAQNVCLDLFYNFILKHISF